MPMKTGGGASLGVVAGDVLALRGTGLAAQETWALLCQAAQALQDLFLSNGGVVGGGARSGPVVTPHTIELTAHGRVSLLQAPPDTARAYLPPEYRPGRVFSDTDSEKMWMYSLGRALLDTTPRVTALTGTVSVSPSSALQSVLAAMTDPDPRRRATLMSLLDVISEYCRTRMQSRPFSHIIIDMYREVVQSPQYAARKRVMMQSMRGLPSVPLQQEMKQQKPKQQQHHHPLGLNAVPARQNPPSQPQQQPLRHRVKGALFRLQSRNSRSQPNLLSMSSPDARYGAQRTNADGGNTSGYGYIPDTRHLRQHTRTNSQPDCTERGTGLTIPQVRSSSNLAVMAAAASVNDARNANIPYYGDPIYAMPVKPFLSSQDVRNSNARQFQRAEVCTAIGRNYCGNSSVQAQVSASSQPSVSHLDNSVCGQTHPAKEDLYATSTKKQAGPIALQRQHSSPQFTSTRCAQEQKPWGFANPLRAGVEAVRAHNQNSNGEARKQSQQTQQQQQQEQKHNAEGRIPYVPRGPPPPKPPRIITSLKKAAAAQAALDAELRANEKPQRDLKNGPRARRGRAVQRAPSRLYRTVNGPALAFNKTQCVGPEFVVRAHQPAKVLTVGDFKMNNIGRLTVILLTGQRVEVTCDPQKITAGELFQAIVQTEGLEENFTLGLAALLAGDFAMLPPDTKLNKVAPPGWLNSGKSKGLLGLPTSFMLYLRLRFFLPSLRGIRSWISKHLLYLQIRRCILEQQLVCPLTQLISLTGLALQAEFGNYSANEHGCGDYFLLEHYVPESLILNSEEQQYRHPQLPDSGDALRKRLQQAHRERRGLDANKAEEMFITHAQSLLDYGAHYYIATVDAKELGKIVDRQKKFADQNQQQGQEQHQQALYIESENIYDIDKSSDYPIYGKIDFTSTETREQNLHRSAYTDEQKIILSKGPSSAGDEIYATPRKASQVNSNSSNASSNNKSAGKSSKFKRSDRDVWLAIHSQGLKVFERGGRLRKRLEIAKFQWKDIQTLSYGKNYLVVYTRISGKRCKFKLKMDHRKSYYAFKLTSLHHQFYLKLRSELTSLQGLANDFGVPLVVEPNSPLIKTKPESAKTKISIADSVKKQQIHSKYPTRLEEQQNKENENPLKDSEDQKPTKGRIVDPPNIPDENNVLYAQVTARLEPEGESRDTEDEADRALIINKKNLSPPNTNGLHVLEHTETDRIYNYANIGIPYADEREEYIYNIPKPFPATDVDRLTEKIENTEDLYAAINKSGLPKKTEFSVPDGEDWKVSEVQKTLQMVKPTTLSNYDTNRQNENCNSPNMVRRLDSKTGSTSTYSALVKRNLSLTDDLELLSLKSETVSIRSTSAKSTASPVPEAYVLNADIRTSEETFRIPDETMSTSLMARLDELSFAEERILRTIKLERGHGGSIGLQVTEGNDGGVYVQAVSVGGSADMAGNVNKGDRIVAINGQSLLNLRYEDALKMLQSSTETLELVLSQIVPIHDGDDHDDDVALQAPIENNYLQNIRFNVASEAENTGVMSTKWLQKTIDVASVQNTSSAYSSAASSAMGNHNVNSLYVPDIEETNAINSANESPLPPPVPPRRKRCRVEPKRPAPLHPRASKLERKHRPAPPLPPPAAPQRIRVGRKTPSSFPNETSSPTINFAKLHVSFEHESGNYCELEVKNKCVKAIEYEEVEITKASPRKSETKSVDPKKSKIKRSNSPFSKSHEPNQYPPLYFTFQDFQTVMEGSLNKSDECIEQMPEKIKVVLQQSVLNDQIDETVEIMEIPTKIEKELIIEVNQAVIESEAIIEQQKEGTEKLPEKSSKDSEIIFSPFMETVTFDNAREEIYFRVTTTDRPFEKFLGDWNKSYDDDVEEFSEKQSSDLYIFEDYMDRSNKLNARPHLLFTEDYFSISEDNSAATEKSTTRVRFLIESPSTSTPDLDLDDDGTSYGEFVERQFQNYEKPSVQLFEITDEESHNLDEDLSNIDNKDDEVDAENKLESDTVEDEYTSESLSGLTRNQSNDSCSDWEEDTDVFKRSARVDNHVTVELPSENNIEISELDDKLTENALLENKNTDELELCPENSNITNQSEKTFNRRTIFIDSSLYKLSNEENNEEDVEKNTEDTKLDENPQLKIPRIIKPIESYDDDTIDDEETVEQKTLTNIEKNTVKTTADIIPEIIPIIKISSAEKKSVPVNVSRNFFLETMLSDNNSSRSSCGMATVNCEVIAAHPKQEPSTPAEQQNTKPPNVDTIVTVEAETAPRNNSKIKLTESGSRPKSQGSINASPSNTKSASEVKNNVLNELLTNFSSIKLRPVNTNSRESINHSEDLSDRSTRSVTKFVDAKTDETHEIKGEQNVVENKEDANPRIDENSNLSSVEKKSGGIAPGINKDTCAIVKEAPYTQRNHNDNKAMTSVVVSKDQFREAVSITPGSVRSFVKYYEIHSEISTISKIKDNAFKKQKSELARENDKANKVKKSTKTGESNKNTSKTSMTSKAEIIKDKENFIGKSSKVSVQHSASPSSSPKPLIQQLSCMKNKAPSPKPERKKSVQFDRECTLINPRKKQKEKEEEEGTFSSFIGGIRTRLKGKAPLKPDVKKTEQPKGLKPDQWRAESAAIICIQNSPEAKTVACASKPGNRSFLPKTETLQSNQTIVFYCTV